VVFLIRSKVPVIKLLQQGDEDQVQVHSQEYQSRVKFAYVRSVRAKDLQVGYLTLEWHAPRPDRDRRRKSSKLWMRPLSRNYSHQGRHPSPSHSRWQRRIWDPGKRDVFEIFFCIYDSSWSWSVCKYCTTSSKVCTVNLESVQVRKFWKEKETHLWNVGADSIAQRLRHWNFMFSTGRRDPLSPIGADVFTSFDIGPRGPMCSQWPLPWLQFLPKHPYAKFSVEAPRPLFERDNGPEAILSWEGPEAEC